MKESIYLRAFELSDLPLINQWHNDPDINLWTGGRQYFVSIEYDRQWIEEKIFNNNTQIYCAICEVGSKEIIGYISLNDINLVNRNAFWGGIVIDQSVRGEGYATKAAVQILKYGFFTLGLKKISGKWLVQNTVSIFMAKMLGFIQEGVLRKEVFKNNQFCDVLVMSILKEEFEERIKQL